MPHDKVWLIILFLIYGQTGYLMAHCRILKQISSGVALLFPINITNVNKIETSFSAIDCFLKQFQINISYMIFVLKKNIHRDNSGKKCFKTYFNFNLSHFNVNEAYFIWPSGIRVWILFFNMTSRPKWKVKRSHSSVQHYLYISKYF